MDRKSIIVIVVCFGLLLMWPKLANKIWPPKPIPQEQLQPAQPRDGTNVPPDTTSATNTTPSSQPVEVVGQPSEGLTTLAPAPSDDTPETTEVVETDVAQYTFTSRGGGLKNIQLKQYNKYVECQSGDDPDARLLAMLNEDAPEPIFGLIGDKASYSLDRRGNRITARTLWPGGMEVIREYEMGEDFVVNATVRLRNTTNTPLVLPQREWVVGTATPLNVPTDAQYQGVFWSDGDDKEKTTDSWFQNKTLGCFPGTPRSLYSDGNSNVVWAAAVNQFFAITLIPDRPAQQVHARRLDLPPPTPEELEKHSELTRDPVGHLVSLQYLPQTLQPGESVERTFMLYAGPKEYKTLANLANEKSINIDALMDFGFFGIISKLLLSSMKYLHDSFGMAFGVAIIIITVIIKTLFWPLTAASTRSMKRMSELQPQMKAIQEKYKEEPQKMQKKLMEFMKENKVNPMSGCLPLLLQMPVFFGFFWMLRTAIELRGASFLWICDLSRPDTLFEIPGLGIPFNLMPLLMGVTMLYQVRLTPPSPGMDPAQQAMMRYLPLMFLFFLYNMSSGLTLYWTVQNLLSILQTKLTRARDDKKKVQGGAAKPPAAAPKSPALKPPKKKKRP